LLASRDTGQRPTQQVAEAARWMTDLLSLGQVWSARVVEGEELEDELPFSTVRVEAVGLVLLPLGQHIGNSRLLSGTLADRSRRRCKP